MTDIHFDTTTLGGDRLSELEAWVRSLIGDMADKVRPYGRITSYTSGRTCLHLSQVVTDHFGNPVIEEAKEPPETATMPLVIDLDDKRAWPAWLEDGAPSPADAEASS
jgi:hypothetical protein